MIAHDLIERKSIVIDAKSGVSGAGRAPETDDPLPGMQREYLGLQRRPTSTPPEIDQVLSRVGGSSVEVIFTPHLVPMDRGILATIYADPKQAAVERDLLEMYRRFYADSPFVRVVDRLPATKDSAFTNFCDIALRVVRGKIIIISCLDNLIKGAAGVAVQNINLIHGFAETTALY